MLFEKNNELVDINISKKSKKVGTAIFESGEIYKIAGISKIKSTIEKIAFLEKKGFRVYI